MPAQRRCELVNVGVTAPVAKRVLPAIKGLAGCEWVVRREG